jgi:hypothetical protein
MRLQPDHPGGMDHAHRDLFGVRVEPREIRLGPYRGEAFGIDRRAIGFICVGHRLFLHCRCYLGG